MSNQTGKSIKAFILALIVLLAFGAGYLMHRMSTPGDRGSAGPADAKPASQMWYCSMDPQFIRPGPGKCGICGMDLVPMPGDMAIGSRIFETSPAARALMEIETSPVERRFVDVSVRMVGKVDYDETRQSDITAWVSGRLDRLFVDYTGVPVKKGDHMVELYSPELLSAQEELLQSIQAVKNLENSDVKIMRETAEATVTAAREKLRLLGLAARQIADIEKQKQTTDQVTIYAPAGGIVIHKHAQEGAYVKTGTRIYTLADLSQVWVQLDAYESDLSWLRYGQKVEFSTVAYPGESFTGTISFIDPVLNPVTRTVKVRVNAANTDARLKPGMFVKAVVSATVAGSGKVVDAGLAGKWICPMHLSVVKTAADKCDICEMDLVQAESLGYVSSDAAEQEKPLVIPASAALVTGSRAVVYVELPGAEKPTFEGREIVLGPRAGDFYLVRSGLKEGERVVTRGNFKIDSALQIQAKPSMMSPAGEGKAATGHQHGAAMPSHKMTPPKKETVAEKPVAKKPVPEIIVNARCPIMGSTLDRENVPANLSRMFKGQKIGFCCGGCPSAWDKLSDAEKAAKLKASMPKESGE